MTESDETQTEKPTVQPTAAASAPAARYVKKADVVTARQIDEARLALMVQEHPFGFATISGPVTPAVGDWVIQRTRTVIEHRSDELGGNAQNVEVQVPIYEIVSDDTFRATYEPADA